MEFAVSARTRLPDIGFLQMTDGLGIPTIPGDGQLFTMADGITIIHTVGFGFQIMNGVPHGYRGADLPDITDGLR